MTLLVVLYYCHRVSTQLHLTNNINISINITISFSVSCHEQVKSEVSQVGFFFKKKKSFACMLYVVV